MEDQSLLGVPLPIIGFFCFVLAGVFVYVWPRAKKNVTRGMWLTMGLHYLHPLAWVLLGMAAFLQNKSTQTAMITAAIGVLVYLFFIVLWIRDSLK